MASLACAVSWADTELIEELTLSADTTVTVGRGETKRIEYLSGTASAVLTKDGAGTLEIAIVGNTNATIYVKEGTLKSVRPSGLSLTGDILFRADASDANALETLSEGNTNYVTKIKNADSLMTGMYAAKPTSPNRPNPVLTANALNGLPVFDFGTFQCSKQSGYGAAMEISTKYLINELLYIWQDYEGVEDIDLNGGSTIRGPNPINWRYSYRGFGGGGTDYPMYYTAHSQVTANLYVDGVKRTKDFAPGQGWHLVSAHSTTLMTSSISDYGFYGFGYSPFDNQFGGFRLAEVIACTNVLSEADRTKAVAYLRQKWFGGNPFRQLFVSEGATIDTSDVMLKVTTLTAQENAILTGGKLQFSDSFTSLDFALASGIVEAKDRATSLTENLAFTGDATIDVMSGTAVVDRVSSTSGILAKTGDGALELAFPDAAVTSLVVSAGSLVVDPLATSRAYIHVDANAPDTMTFSNLNGTNLVTKWYDVNGNGRYLRQSSERHAYGTKALKNYPFLVENFTNGLSVVDFGTFNDYWRQNGWGAEMDLYPMVRSPQSETNPVVYNVFAVWGDREESKDIPLVDGNEFKGPCLFGNGGSWYRGLGGGGSRFMIMGTQSSTMGNSNWVNGQFIDYVSWMNTYAPPERLFLQNTFVTEGVTVQQIGGNATQTSTGATRGVAGGLRLGELMVFRYRVPDNERFRVDRALMAKWFGSENVCTYGSLSVTNEAVLAFPYADVTVTNLTLAGTVSARSLAVRNLDIVGGATVSAPLALSAGGMLALCWDGSGFGEVAAESFSIGDGGTLAIHNADVASLCGRSFRVVACNDISGTGAGWIWHSADRTVRAVIEKRADGIYVTFGSSGFRVFFR